MAKKINKKKNIEEVVANCDQLEEVIANSCSGKRPIGPSGENQESAVTKCDLKTY